MATSVASSWDPDAAREVFDFDGSWLGQRVLRAQASRRVARTLAKFQAWSADVDLDAYSPERIELLQRIDRALLTSQTAVWLNRAMLDAGLAALGEGVPSGAAEPFRALRVPVRPRGAGPVSDRCGSGAALESVRVRVDLRRGPRALRRVRGVAERAVVGRELRARVPRDARGRG